MIAVSIAACFIAWLIYQGFALWIQAKYGVTIINDDEKNLSQRMKVIPTSAIIGRACIGVRTAALCKSMDMPMAKISKAQNIWLQDLAAGETQNDTLYTNKKALCLKKYGLWNGKHCPKAGYGR